MAFSQKLQLKQGQSLVMTQQLQQSIKLLQLSSLELAGYIEQELERNPLLTTDETDDSTPNSQEDTNTPAEEPGAELDTLDAGKDASMLDRDNDHMDSNFKPEEDWTDESSPNLDALANLSAKKQTSYSSAEYDFEQNTSKEISLKDHLTEQLNLQIHEPVERFIALYIIDLIDADGYFKEDQTALAEQIGCDVELIDRMLKEIQSFDPIGIAATSLQECLAMQLRELDHYDPAMEKLVNNLDLLAKGDFKKLEKICEVDEEDLLLMYQEIKALNPKPGSQFSHEIVEAVQPDIFLRRSAKKEWLIELNTDALPKPLLNQRYYSKLTKEARNKEEKKYLSEQMANANWLVKALDQRANTILKVATEIVAKQDEFFKYGVQYLKPMTLKDIAEEVEMHESTISRVTTHKYMATSRGIYELKYFFSSSVHSNTGEENVSSISVKHLIKEIVDAESVDAVLSDDAIVNALKEKGITVARRTVTKYREAMHIPSSVVRRREKRKLAI
jgi:RNA polymerase sigma-54 factor